MVEAADLLAKLHAETRIPSPDQVGKVDKGYGKLDYLGHAAVTDALLAHDPEWSWEPYAEDENGLPKIMYDAGGRPRGMWIRLTVHGHSRIGIGTCSATAAEPYKELIGDALRNAAMRFGVGLALWAKEDWAEQGLEAGETESQAGERSPGGNTRGGAPGENVPRPGNVRTLPKPTSEDIARHPSNGPTLPTDQALAARAVELGLTEEERQQIIWGVTDGRTRSGKELRGKEPGLVFAAMEAKAKSRA